MARSLTGVVPRNICGMARVASVPVSPSMIVVAQPYGARAAAKSRISVKCVGDVRSDNRRLPL